MSPEERELLNRSVLLAEDNNKMLHSMKRSMLWARFMSIIYWVIIIGASVGAYYFIEPYLNKILDLYNTVTSTQEKIGGGVGSIEDLLKNFKLR